MTRDTVHLWRPLADLAKGFAGFAGWWGPLAGMLMLAGSALEGMSLALVVPLVSLLIGHRTTGHQALSGWLSRAGLDTPDTQLYAALGAFVVAMTLRALILAARDRLLMSLQIAFTDQQRLDIVTSLAASRWQDITALRHARITHALGSEIPRAASALHLLLAITTSAAMLFAQWLLILVLSPGLALTALLALLPLAMAAFPLLRQAGALGQSLTGGGLRMFDATQQFLGGLKPALAQNLETSFLAEYRHTLTELARGQNNYVRRQGQARIVATAVAALALAIAVLLARRLALPVAVMVGVLAIFQRMFGPAMTILRSAQQLAGMLPSSQVIDQLKRELESGVSSDREGEADIAPGGIRFDRVSYSYRQNGEDAVGILGLSLLIEPGEILGVDGASGAGKTSFVDLLAGLILPDAGIISIGGVALEPCHRKRLRERISYVTQDGFLFHDTVRRNLCWGLSEPDEERLWRTLEMVEAAPFVRTMDDGLETVVGERACRLSGGERQRLALARALLRSPDILILDEATNALDLGTEGRVLRRIATIDPHPTIVIVSHRPETLGICSRILTFARGALVEDRRLAEIVSA